MPTAIAPGRRSRTLPGIRGTCHPPAWRASAPRIANGCAARDRPRRYQLSPVPARTAALALAAHPGPCAESLLWSCLTTVPLASVTVASAVADDEQTPAACGTLDCPVLAVAE